MDLRRDMGRAESRWPTRGPLGVNLTIWFGAPVAFSGWATQLEVQAGRPVLHVHAGMIAG